jgi:CheY-like chemotaxis protein
VKPSVLIFIVEDDITIQQILQAALEDGGYEVTSAFSGTEAMAILEAQLPQFSALITDVNLSGTITGWDIAERGREINPELPVIYMTAASGHEWASKGVPNSILLAKPFAPAQLVTAVSQLLNVTG